MMKHIFVLLIAILPFFATAQKASKFGRTLTDTLPAKFQLNISPLRAHIYDGIPATLKSGLNERACFRFADQSAVQLSQLLSSGNIYTDWPELEAYVNQVLKKVMPPELEQDTVIHAYLVKDGNFNAFMTPLGLVFVNIGLLDELPSEAALAAILTHELAHYHLRHSLKNYIKDENKDFERVFLKTDRSKHSIQNELQADSLGILLIVKSPLTVSNFWWAKSNLQLLKKLPNQKF